MTTAIQVNDLHYTYEGQDGGETHIVFDGLNLSIEQGSFVAVLGHNGCGKSTLAKHFNAILLPAGGSVMVYGMDTKDEALLLAVRQHVGMVFQNPDNQIVSNVVEEDVAFAPENLGVASQEIRQRVDDALKAVGMYDYRTYAPQLLSGGQKQRVAIAGVLAMQPQCVVLDEPTAMLDPLAAQNLLAMVERINRELGVAILLTEHRLDAVLQAADRVAVMEDGMLLSCGKPAEIACELSGAKNKSRVFFGFPASVRIFAELGAKELPLSVRDARRRMDEIKPKDNMTLPKQESSAKQTEMLRAKELWFRWDESGKDILRGAEVALHQNEILCLLGGNGAGKTTLLKVLSGVKKPYRGKVKLQKGAKLCMLPQMVASLFVTDNVKDELLESAEQDEARALQMAEKLELTKLLHQHPYDLSGGEAQRLAIGKLLLRDANVLLLDEPTKGLDAYAKQNLAQLLRKLAAEGAAILIVTHDVEFAAQYATRCALMFDGMLLSGDEPHAFFAGNRFYTTDANRIASNYLPQAITCEEVIAACKDSL